MRTPCYRGYQDYSCFCMSICRDVQRAVEAQTRTPPEMTAVIFALQQATLMRYDTGKGLTPGNPSRRGVGQGCFRD